MTLNSKKKVQDVRVRASSKVRACVEQGPQVERPVHSVGLWLCPCRLQLYSQHSVLAMTLVSTEFFVDWSMLMNSWYCR